MNPTDRKHSNNLREAILALYHSGPNGFEGLLGIVLASVTGQSFRLAKSGSQRGRDGDSAFDCGATYFEGKRYRKSPKPPEIAAKLFDLVKDDAGQLDLWVLGATCEVAAQTAADMRVVCERLGIGTVLLDWNDNDLGALLVAVVNAGQESKHFISGNLKSKPKAHLIEDALDAIDHFARHPHLPARLETLREALLAEEAGLGQARVRNRERLMATLSSRVSARVAFGQPLAPRDTSGLSGISRPLEAKLVNAFKGQPTAELYAVTGDEGVGKSWLTASAWLSCNPSSILVICPAEDLLELEATGNFESFIITKLIQETGDQRSDRATERWRRRIRGWRSNPAPKNVRVTMIFDGLNQPLKSDWSKHLNNAAFELAKLGGCLVMSTRRIHWARLRNNLVCKVAEVLVDQWTVAEVKDIIQGRGIDANKVKSDVLESLRNPRILGIAIDLLSANDVETIDQLSVGRLMFEHLRKAQTTGAVPMSATEFVQLLKGLANETLVRARNQQTDDLRVFSNTNHRGLQDVASSRFFVPVKGSLQYEIKQEGLNLGLALSLIDALEKELRNERDPRDRLAIILEPITALDEAASIVFLATQIACLDEEASSEVRSALIEHFVSLQNLPNDDAGAFAVLVRTAAPSFLTAAQKVHTSESHVPNADWLLYALHSHRDNPTVWAAIADAVRRWLACYSLAPERMMFKSPSRDPKEKVIEERNERKAAINKKVEGLTDIEKAYWDENLICWDRWNFATLHRLAFFLLAGKPLEGFADDLVRWSFSDALGPAIHAPYKEFRQLIRFNRTDWKESRDALIKKIKTFKGDNSSTVGKWTIVGILRATGDLEDAKEAEELAEWLTRDREKFRGWSRIADYCAVDPCDPRTIKPDNVTTTALLYRAIDPAKLANHMSHTSEDHFFDMARTGVTRFHLDDAVIAHRALADDILTRTGLARRQGAFTLLEHSAALTGQQARKILKAGQASTATFDSQRDNRDEWCTAQYSVFIAIAHLPADEQLESIASVKGNPILLDILDALLPSSESAAERVLERVLQSTDTDKQSSILAAIRYSRPTLSTRSRSIIAELLEAGDAGVRTEALGAAAASGVHALLKAVVKCGWEAEPMRAGKQTFERWYGSSAILVAAKYGIVTLEDALNRMALEYYGFAAQALGPAASKVIAKRVDVALAKALSYTQTSELPVMTTATPNAASARPPLISLYDPPPSQDLRDQLDRLGETAEQFDARQSRVARSFDSFTRELTMMEANLVLADLTLGGVKALVDVDQDAGKRWIGMLSAASDAQLRHLHHVAVQLAVTLVNDADAEQLLTRLMGIEPTIHRVQGVAKVPAECLALWANADKLPLRGICKRRLVTRQDDREIAHEVLAAILSGRAKLVEETIDELLASGQPADTCGALTLAGFCDESPHAVGVLARFDGAQGYIGIAQRTASDSYMRNVWARSWYEQMRTAKTPLEFWEASVLLTKIVDLRFDIWVETTGAESDICRAFFPTVRRAIERRIEKWQMKRKDHLFGDKSPAHLFLPDETV